MKISVDIITLIVFLGAIQGYFIALTLFTNTTGNRRANNVLGLLFLGFALSITNIFLIRTGLYIRIFFPINLPLIISFLFGPLFLYYVKFHINRDLKLKLSDGLHLIPFSIAFLYYFRLYFYSKPFINQYIHSHYFFETPIFDWDIIINLILLQLHTWFYLLTIHRIIGRHERKIVQFYSSIEEKSLQWIKFFINCFIAVYSIFIVFFIFGVQSDRSMICAYLGVVVSISIFILGFQGLRQPEIFLAVESTDIKEYTPPTPELKLDFINDPNLSNQLNSIVAAIQDEQLYKNPDLTLLDLSKKLSMPRHTLSQIINDGFGMSFCDFINQYRVDHFKKLIDEPENKNLTFLALAEESGFKSKSSFYRIFKKHTNMTPSDYKSVKAPNDNQLSSHSSL